MLSACYVCCIYSSPSQTIFFTAAINMNPDQTAPWEQSDPGPYCLQYTCRLPKNISRWEEQTTKVQRVNICMKPYLKCVCIAIQWA